jgi:ABC-type transport system substrate-binding protein
MTKVCRPPALAAVLLAILGLLPADPAPRQQAEGAPHYNGTLRIKGYLTPFNPNFDPAGSPHYFIVEQLFDGLVKFDSNFAIVPSLAEYWTISDDGTRITFFLRKGVRFHNGRELTADDVKFSLERLVQNRPGNPIYEYFVRKVAGAEDYWLGKAAEVTGFRVIDRSTFEIQWLRPYASGLFLLSMYYCKILPKDLLLAQGKGFFQKPIGTGPFKFASWLLSTPASASAGPRRDIAGVRLERNGGYFGKRPYLFALEYSPYYTEEQFEQGAVHIFPVISGRPLDEQLVLENNTLRSGFLAMSCQVPPFDRPEVRRALALGLNKAKLAAAALTASSIPQVSENFIPPMLPGFFPRDAVSPYEPEKAKLLLDRLLPEAAAKPLELTLVFLLPKSDVTAGLSRELEREMSALGINAGTKYLRKATDISDVKGPYLKFLDWTMTFPDPENIVEPLFRSGSSTNALNFNYANPAMDALIDQAEVERSWERRTELFRRMEKILFEELPGLPIFSERVRIYLDPRVRGAKLPPLGFYFLDTKNIWLED